MLSPYRIHAQAGITPLMIAFDNDMEACKKALIDAGADPNFENKVGSGVLGEDGHGGKEDSNQGVESEGRR